MFTGIIRAMGCIGAAERGSAGARLSIECPELDSWRLATGDSVAVAGVCLTALEIGAGTFAADVSAETLARTGLGALAPGDPVNLEPALAAGDALGGHLVTGHVDGLARLESRTPEGESVRMRFVVPEALARFVAEKGAVTLDGVSLTVNRVDGSAFEVNLIPHTLRVTTLGRLQDNDRVNLEVDLIARYVDRLLEARKHS